ncbi:hypothetical protein ES708_24624 [subsurface metagenome]
MWALRIAKFRIDMPYLRYLGILALPVNLEPITTSKPSSIFLSRRGISLGSCWPSASNITMAVAFSSLAVLKAVLKAAPYPKFLPCLITAAPSASLISPVLSVLPSSTTITRSTFCLVRRTTLAIDLSSL